MTKRDLVVRISSETNLIQQDVLTVVQKTLDYITEALAAGVTVELRNFGVFEVKTRKARVGRNPNRPETDVPIPARSVVKFKPGKEMKEMVLQIQAGKATPAGPTVVPKPAVPTPVSPPVPMPTPDPAAMAATPPVAKKKLAATKPALNPAVPIAPSASPPTAATVAPAPKRKNVIKPK